MYEFKTDINIDDYNSFIYNYSMAPITQDYRWAKVKNNWDNTLCGLYKDNVLVGVSLLLIKTFPFNLKMIYSPRGFLIDYTNIEYLKEFTNGIKKYAKKIKAFLIKIDPPICITEEYYENYIKKSDIKSPKNYSIDNKIKIYNLKKCGYIHNGYKKGLGDYIQPRYNMIISLINSDNKIFTESEFLNNLKRNAKRYYGDFQIKRGISFKCYHDDSHVKEFYEIIKTTENRQGISLRSEEYYKRIMNSFKKGAYMYIAEIDVNIFIEFLENEINKIKDKDLINKYKSQLEDAKNIRNKYGDIIPLACTLAIASPNNNGIKKVEYLYAGTNEDIFPYLNANVGVHINSFIEFLNKGYSYADLEGIDGNLNDHLTKTKEKYNPILFEYIGEFDLSTNRFWYFIFSKFSVQLKRIYKLLRGRNK